MFWLRPSLNGFFKGITSIFGSLLGTFYSPCPMSMNAFSVRIKQLWKGECYERSEEGEGVTPGGRCNAGQGGVTQGGGCNARGGGNAGEGV